MLFVIDIVIFFFLSVVNVVIDEVLLRSVRMSISLLLIPSLKLPSTNRSSETFRLVSVVVIHIVITIFAEKSW